MLRQLELSLKDIYEARRLINPYIRKTPLIEFPELTKSTGARFFAKAENLQETGSFKIRGAANKLLHLSEEQKARGVLTCSSGNHGRALSMVAKKLGIHAVVCITEAVPSNKRQAILNLGGELIVGGKTADEALFFADQLEVERSLTMTHSFDDPNAITGQATIGLEILEDAPQIDTFVVPLSGGSLCSGIALAVKTANPKAKVIGVSMERAPVMIESLKAGRVIELPEEPTLADGLAGGLGQHNHWTFRYIQALLDETVTVSEEEIADAMYHALNQHHLVLEGAGAVGLAAVMAEKIKPVGKHAAIVLSGGNVNLSVLMKIVNERLALQTA
jgi:threonine dehydratase